MFLGVLIDGNFSWKAQIAKVSSTISKSIGILYKASTILNKLQLKQLYHSFIHSYLSYANIAWGSTHKSKLETLYRRQKHAIRIIYAANRLAHTKPLFMEMKILNVYEINVFQVLTLMFKCKHNISPKIFQNLFSLKPPNKYILRRHLLVEPFVKTKFEEFCISSRRSSFMEQNNNCELYS